MLITFSGCKQPEATSESQFVTVENVNGPTLGYSRNSGVTILEIDGLKFRDLNRNGSLDKYEDWRLSPEMRATDLASKMSIEQIAGLMLYSPQQSLPALPMGDGPAEGTYNGKNFSESDAKSWELTDQQKIFLGTNNVRHVLLGAIENPATAARWNNEIQSFTERIGLGIPCNTSSDPRHAATGNSEFNSGSGGAISLWPDGLGLAATFDPAVIKRFGEIASREYRAPFESSISLSGKLCTAGANNFSMLFTLASMTLSMWVVCPPGAILLLFIMTLFLCLWCNITEIL